MKEIDLTYRTMFAELVQRSLDASVESEFSTAGNFVRVPVKGRDYWYFEETQPKKTRKYVGSADDPDIAARVEAFQHIKDVPCGAASVGSGTRDAIRERRPV